MNSSQRPPNAFCVTCQSSYAHHADAEVARIIPDARLHYRLKPGTQLFSTDRTFDEVAQLMRVKQPVFVRHICPATHYFRYGSRYEVADRCLAIALRTVDPCLSFSVQSRIFGTERTRPFDINREISDRISQLRITLNVRQPQQIVSVLLDRPHGWTGVSFAHQNLSSWTGGEHRFRRTPDQISRAEFKLLEALQTFDVFLDHCERVVELGAAPGGWTRILLDSGISVVAVDPASMAQRLLSHPKLTHLKMRAEQCFPHLTGVFGGLLSDMRMDPSRAARLVCRIAPLLRRRALMILTLKLRVGGSRQEVDRALGMIRQRYTVAGARQLFHNRNEVTVVGTKK